MLYLSIDFGTSAVKMSIVDENLQTLSSSKGMYHYLILPGEKNELQEKDLLAALYAAAEGLDPELRAKVELLCYDTFSPSPIFLDKEGNLVYPNIITHLDRRSRAQTQYITENFGKDRYMNISGIYPFPGGCSAMTLIWFKQNMPEVLDKTYIIGHLPTYIHKLFTGEFMVDFVNASMMGMYETVTQSGWSKELIREFGLPEHAFQEIRYPGTDGGFLKADIAEKLGVKAGIPVCIGTNDVAAAQMGAGNETSGNVMNTTGSSEMVSILTDTPKVSPEYYLRNSALPGLWQIYATTCGGFGIDWFYEQFCREMTKDEFFSYEEKVIYDYLEKGETEVTFDPYLTGDRQSLEKRTGAWKGLTLGSTRDDMLIAYMVGIQDVMMGAISNAQKVTDITGKIKISGGMATKAYMDFKKKFYKDLEFEVVDDCPIKGNVRLVQHYHN